MKPWLAGVIGGVVGAVVMGTFASIVAEAAMDKPEDPRRPSDEAYYACLQDPACDWQRMAEMRSEYPPGDPGVSEDMAWRIVGFAMTLGALVIGTLVYHGAKGGPA